MIKVIKECLTTKEIDVVNEYLMSANFNTRENHIPLHDNLFSNNQMDFGITTYGDMGKEISYIFNKICQCIIDCTSEISKEQYGSPILTKSYIMKFDNTNELMLGFDALRPPKVFRSMVFWNKEIENIHVVFPEKQIKEELSPGDIIIFPETQEFSRKILNKNKFPIYMSDFWNAPKNESPYPGLHHDEIAWGNPMYDKID